MKIGPIESKLNVAAAPAGDRRSSGATTAATSEPSAKVELSAAAVQGGEDGSFDKAKVERIASAIREGRFSVDAGAIADKLIANAQEVLGRMRS